MDVKDDKSRAQQTIPIETQLRLFIVCDEFPLNVHCAYFPVP